VRTYLFDTPIMAALVNHRPGAVALASPWIAAHEAATSALVCAEVFEYIRPSRRFLRHYQTLRSLLRAVHPLGVNLPILSDTPTSGWPCDEAG
jgi:hypothetical protein